MSPAVPTRMSHPLVGYRCWIGQKRGLVACLQSRWSLTAVGGDIPWPTAQIAARCEEGGGHGAPNRRCTCGIHAFDSIERAVRYARSRQRFWRRGPLVLGAVQLWGDVGQPVIVGELAGEAGFQYRAAHARIVALVDGPQAREIGGRLGVAVVRQDYLEPFAREFGVELRDGRESERPVRRARTGPAPFWVRWLRRVPRVGIALVIVAGVLAFVGHLTAVGIVWGCRQAARFEIGLLEFGWRRGWVVGAMFTGIALPLTAISLALRALHAG